MRSDAHITVVTSIPPVSRRLNAGEEIGEEYQRRCIDSWIGAGFNVLSVNDRSEAETISANYPNISVHTVERNASELGGKPVPWIDDLFLALKRDGSAYCGIINADILLDDGPWIDTVSRLASGGLLAGKRHDVEHLDGAKPKLDPYGYDLFFFEIESIGVFKNNEYAMGLPWWDYWLPIAARLNGLPVRRLDRPLALHLEHGDRWDRQLYEFMGEKFVSYVNAEAPAGVAGMLARLGFDKRAGSRTGLKDVLKRCRNLGDPSYPDATINKPDQTRGSEFDKLAAAIRDCVDGRGGWPGGVG